MYVFYYDKEWKIVENILPCFYHTKNDSKWKERFVKRVYFFRKTPYYIEYLVLLNF